MGGLVSSIFYIQCQITLQCSFCQISETLVSTLSNINGATMYTPKIILCCNKNVKSLKMMLKVSVSWEAQCLPGLQNHCDRLLETNKTLLTDKSMFFCVTLPNTHSMSAWGKIQHQKWKQSSIRWKCVIQCVLRALAVSKRS